MAATFAVDHAPESTHEVSFDLAELTKMYDFTGLVVAVTGGAGVLGSEMARAIAGCGAQVAILDLNVEPAKALIDRSASTANRSRSTSATSSTATASPRPLRT